MTRLLIGNLASEATPVDLHAAFAAYGLVSSAEIAIDESNGRSAGFGFVEMTWQAHAVAAIQALDGTDLKGRSMQVTWAPPRSDGGLRGNPPRGWDVVGGGGGRRRADGD